MPGAEPFTQDYATVLDGAGHGSVSFGPNRLGQSWAPPMTVAVKTSTSVLVPTAEVFVDSVSLGVSYTGSGDTDDIPNVTVHVGSRIKVVWTGGDPGAVATVTLACTLIRR